MPEIKSGLFSKKDFSLIAGTEQAPNPTSRVEPRNLRREASKYQNKFVFATARYPGLSDISRFEISPSSVTADGELNLSQSLEGSIEDTIKGEEGFPLSKSLQVRTKIAQATLPYQSEILLCSTCLVEFTKSRIRRHRMGLIRLQCKVMHIWFQSSRPAVFSLFTGLAPKYLRKIANYKGYTVSSRSFWNPCLSPGGDFYDTEWEFIHSWLGRSLSNSASATPPKLTHEAGYGEAYADAQKDSSLGPNSRSSFALRALGGQFFDSKESFVSTALVRGTNGAFCEARNGTLRRFRRNSLLSRSRAITKPTHTSFGNSQKSSRFGVFAAGLESQTSIYPYFACDGSMQIKIPFKHVPNWLIGTGASALSDLCESRNWLEIQLHLKSFLLGNTSALLPLPSQTRESIAIEGSSASGWGSRNLRIFSVSSQRSSKTGTSESISRESSARSDSALNITSSLSGNLGLSGLRPSAPDALFALASARALASAKPRNSKIDSKRIPTHSHVRLFKALELILSWSRSPFFPSKLTSSFVTHFGSRSGYGEAYAVASPAPKSRNINLLHSFIFDRIPVLPPELRPIVEVHPGQLASSDVNDLYRRLISRNSRLKYYSETRLPVEFLVRSERHLVQLACDALFENGKTTHLRHQSGSSRASGGNQMTSGGPLYRSLTDRIGGKYGRFRQNLLGKRVDYSGRSVICVGPHLKLHECGLPSFIAQELFQPFLIRHILEFQFSRTIRGAKKILQLNFALTQSLLRQIMESHPILLNRAPTLHRLGIQAFQPKLHNGKAIELHPAVCSAFNADFDGDQMAVHLPLSPRARTEARLLMLANTNWLSPATGSPSIVPSQDIVLGFYYLTSEIRNLQHDSAALSVMGKLRALERGKDINRAARATSVALAAPTTTQAPNSTHNAEARKSILFSLISDARSAQSGGAYAPFQHNSVFTLTEIESALASSFSMSHNQGHESNSELQLQKSVWVQFPSCAGAPTSFIGGLQTSYDAAYAIAKPKDRAMASPTQAPKPIQIRRRNQDFSCHEVDQASSASSNDYQNWNFCKSIIGSQTRDILSIRNSTQALKISRLFSSQTRDPVTFYEQKGDKIVIGSSSSEKKVNSSSPALALISFQFSLLGHSDSEKASTKLDAKSHVQKGENIAQKRATAHDNPSFETISKTEVSMAEPTPKSKSARNFDKEKNVLFGSEFFPPEMSGTNIFEPLHIRIFHFGNGIQTYPEFQIHAQSFGLPLNFISSEAKVQSPEPPSTKLKNQADLHPVFDSQNSLKVEPRGWTASETGNIIRIRTTPGRILCTNLLKKYWS